MGVSTAAFTVARAQPAGEDSDKTVIMAPAGAAPDYEATVVSGAMPLAEAPGYDAGPKTSAALSDAFEKTVINRPPMSGAAPGDGGKRDL
jgi:hypothetical protein